ncbi:MAG: phosphatidylserine decarboxylase [Acidobacteria bacterium]|nr:phosphatidylserine decarboxylase [Acidobacteriota bacterium]
MVRDGIYYGLAFIAVAALLAWLLGPAFAILPLLLAAFFLQFFRDPERAIPNEPGALVSAADGKVTDISTFETPAGPRTRVSVFLNVFDVHVNRSPVSGVISNIEYRRGKFGNAMGGASADVNEQNIVTIATDDGQTVVMKQIAGLLARRIVFKKRIGDRVQRGERVGLIKFGSRTDVIFDAAATLRLKVGDRVSGGSSVVAVMAQRPAPELTGTAPAAGERR